MFERYSNRARSLIVLALWSAREGGASYIEPEDLLHALIREDRGEFAALSREVFPGTPAPIENLAADHQPFFTDEIAKNLLRALHEDPDPLTPATPTESREPVPHSDMPVSQSLKQVLALAAKIAQGKDSNTIEPLHLLAGIVEDRESRLAELLRDNAVTRQRVAQALNGGAAPG